MENYQGFIGAYKLSNWWEENFSEDEKQYMREKFKPMTGGYLDSGLTTRGLSTIQFLYSLAGWFRTLKDEQIAEKILIKANDIVQGDTPVLDKHFLYQTCIVHYYKKRKISPVSYQLAIDFCVKQIEIAGKAKTSFLSENNFSKLPRHVGYEQYVIILEKEKQFSKAIQICKEAQSQGWNSDWEKRINKLTKKL